MQIVKKPPAGVRDELAALIENLIAAEPFEFTGYSWAARPRDYYCTALAVSELTLQRVVAKPPFVRRSTMVGDTKVCLLRTGIAPPKDHNDYKRIMLKIWREWKTERAAGKVTWSEEQFLWGFAKDMMALPISLGVPLDGGELAVAVLKYALKNWATTISAIKIAMEAKEGYKPRYLKYPSLSAICPFYKAAVYAYCEAVQAGDVNRPEALRWLTTPKSWIILAALDPFVGHPGWTDKMEANYLKLEAAQCVASSYDNMAEVLAKWKHLTLDTTKPDQAKEVLETAVSEYLAQSEAPD